VENDRDEVVQGYRLPEIIDHTPKQKQRFPPILIDTKAEKLFTDAGIARRYVALSYVWGNVKTLKTSKLNFRELQEPGSLSLRSDVPRVIKDAMKFTRLLGETYLWVDALCIIQDGDGLQGYLYQMHMV